MPSRNGSSSTSAACPERVGHSLKSPPSARVIGAQGKDLEVGSRAHYTDAAYYTKTYKRRVEDVAFYVQLAQEIGGPVLEYGAGNGRIALPIARHGVEITAVDLSPTMLGDLRDRLSGEADYVRELVKLRLGDMRDVRLRRRFPLVIATFNSILHLYDRTDFERFFARVRAHLAPGGRFVFDASVPSPIDQGRNPERAYSAPRLRHPTTGQLVKYTERFDHDPIRQLIMVAIEFTPLDEPSASWATPLAHRQLYPLETEALLHYNGFEVVSVAGDFDGGPLDRDSDLAIWTCQLASRKSKRRR